MPTFQNKIYLDYAATTPLDRGVFAKMEPYFYEKYGNPASIHTFGQEAQKAVDEARGRLALFLNCSPAEVIFTSGATEANNLALKGAVRAFYAKHRDYIVKPHYSIKPHFIVSRVEHHCVLDTAKGLAEDGLIEVSYLPVNTDGFVELKELEKTIKDNTILVSIMYANNETGIVNPITEIGAFLKDKGILFHTDATQAVNYLNCRVDKLGVDLLSLSAHKIYGPKGVGALYIKKGSPVARIQDGGAQEYNMRAGTLNVPGIVGLGEAIASLTINNLPARNGYVIGVAGGQLTINKRIELLRNKLVDGILCNIKDTALNGSREQRLPNNANIRFLGAEGEAILLSLDLEGIAVSTASACASRSLKPSHVLTAMGLAGFDAHSSVRFSLGKDTTEEEIDRVIEVLPSIIERLRKIGGEYSKKEQERLPDDFGC